MLTLPGLIDPHVHFRTPGQSLKEDFTTGTKAALAGGFTTIIDMPNNQIPITTLEKLKEKQIIANRQTVCNLGFHFGSLGDNLEEFPKVQNGVMGLKIYLNHTTGDFVVKLQTFEKICDAWTRHLPILLHAEEDIIEKALLIAKKTKQKIHVCHISSKSELQKIIDARMSYENITCGVTPHHLFLTAKTAEKLGPFGLMKPSLKTKEDTDFLWSHLKDIDIIESDHAPHTIEEKQNDNPPSGVPGLETTLPLLITAANKGKLTISDIKRLCYENSKKLFAITQDESTYLEIDENENWTIENKNLFTKCKWSPFDGWKVKGKLKRVFIRGKKVYDNGRILIKPGDGKILKSIL